MIDRCACTPSERLGRTAALKVLAIVALIVGLAAAPDARRAAAAPAPPAVRWYRLSFNASGSYTAITTSHGGLVSTAKGFSAFKGASQSSAALEMTSPGVLRLATSFHGLVSDGHVTQTNQPSPGCTPDNSSVTQQTVASYTFYVTGLWQRHPPSPHLKLDYQPIALGRADQFVSLITCTMPDGTTMVKRAQFDQTIAAAAYASFLCSTNETRLTQKLSGTPAFGRAFDMRYRCRATINDATRDYVHDGHYRLHFTPCPQRGLKRC
jgi:hypothetical protein